MTANPDTTLTWADVAKVCAPFAFAFVLMCAKIRIENRSERKAKQGALWRSISDAQKELIGTFGTIGRIISKAKDGKVVIVAFDIPASACNFANRLAELDPTNADVYISYSSHIQIVLRGIEYLKSLNTAHIQSLEGEVRQRIAMAIVAQASALRDDLLTLTSRELDVLKAIHQANPKFDRQIIEKEEKLIEDASSEIDSQEPDKPPEPNAVGA
jgi:hypothetical protein